MKKIVLLGIIAIILFISTVYIIVSQVGNIKTADNEYKNYIGKKIVVDKDTLTITDYNIILEVFYLSNSVKVNKEYVKKKVLHE